jgi:hypothetical protein
MDWNAYRDENDTDQPDSFWRRRVVTLAAGLGLLGILAWAFSGGGGKSASPPSRSSQAAGVSSAAAYGGTPTSPSSGASQAGPAIPGLPSASPAPAAGASASANSRNRLSALGKPGAASTAPAMSPPVSPAGSGPGPGGRCSPSAVVLSLFTRPEYYSGQYPQFDVYAVSTASGACSFDVGTGHLQVVVMSGGRVIWDSADCSGGESHRVAELRRGVPAQQSVSWNRSITLPGCVTLGSSARLGTYEVQAKSATVNSSVLTFKLARLLLADA